MLAENDLIVEHIEQDPLYPGVADARIRGTGIHVWALVEYLAAAGGDSALVAREYEISEEDVAAACAYYRQHQSAIDSRIEANAA